MDTRVRHLVRGFLNGRRNRAKAVRGISGAYGSLSKAEYEEHTSNGQTPAVYVGTYAKYNDGNLFGQWIDVDSFDDYDEFMDYLHRLHGDERDPEFMVQDYENFPEAWYSETCVCDEDWFNNVKEYADSSQQDAMRAYIDYYGEWDADNFEEAYEGEYNSEEDFAEWLVDEIGMENIQNREYYFDYDKFARDLFISDYDFVDGYVFRQY